MDQTLSQLAQSQLPMNALIVISALVMERLLPLPTSFHPISLFKAVTLGISAKVRPSNRNDSISQQKIASLLAIPTLLFPFMFLSYMMSQVAEFPLIFDGVLLWLCLGWSPIRKDSLYIATAIEKERKSLAKARLSPLVIRDTVKLSPMGQCKATIEMISLRASKEYFAVIFYFLLLGSFFMLFYRLVMVLNHCWNPKLNRFRHFGQAAHKIGYLLEWLPGRLVILTLMALNGFKHAITIVQIAKSWGNDTSLGLLAATASGLKVKLGGPVFYNGQKIRRPVIGNDTTAEPNAKSIRQAVSQVDKILAVWLLVIVLVATLNFVVIKL